MSGYGSSFGYGGGSSGRQAEPSRARSGRSNRSRSPDREHDREDGGARSMSRSRSRSRSPEKMSDERAARAGGGGSGGGGGISFSVEIADASQGAPVRVTVPAGVIHEGSSVAELERAVRRREGSTPLPCRLLLNCKGFVRLRPSQVRTMLLLARVAARVAALVAAPVAVAAAAAVAAPGAASGADLRPLAHLEQKTLRSHGIRASEFAGATVTMRCEPEETDEKKIAKRQKQLERVRTYTHSDPCYDSLSKSLQLSP